MVTSSEFIKELRDVATGEKILQYNFIPKDWSPGSAPLFLWDAADEIERLLLVIAKAAEDLAHARVRLAVEDDLNRAIGRMDRLSSRNEEITS